MIGAGVFSAFAPAAAAAGSGLLVGLVLAAGVAYCNAVASAQLAAQYPTSGGTYVYGRERLGEWWGFLAGFGFVVGKTASCAAMALTFGAYVVPGSDWGAAAVARRWPWRALTGANSARHLAHGAAGARARRRRRCSRSPSSSARSLASGTSTSSIGSVVAHGGVYGVLQAAGLLFFAFAGYARIATLGEEVREPARTIPRAIPLALGIIVVLYLVVGVSALARGRPGGARGRLDAVADGGRGGRRRVGRAGRPGRRRRCEPRRAARADRGHRPHDAGDGAERRPAALARCRASASSRAGPRRARRRRRSSRCSCVTTDLRGAIGFSSFGVLLYYAVANASAFTQSAAHRRWPRCAERRRARRLRHARRHAAALGSRRGRRRVRVRPVRPRRREACGALSRRAALTHPHRRLRIARSLPLPPPHDRPAALR